MKYAVEMGSATMMFHKKWFKHSKVDRGVPRHTNSMEISKAYFYFFKTSEAG
jgi:hypothetical protein